MTYPDVVPTKVGQLRIDTNGQRVRVVAADPDGRYRVTYPGVEGRTSVLSAGVIESHYPNVLTDVIDPGGPL